MTRELPLTDADRSGTGHGGAGPDDGSPVREDVPTEADIRTLVVAFYTKARGDETIGPIFEREIEDWDEHFDRLCDFWSSAILKTGRYSGRPGMKHFGLGLTPQHFSRWLGIWERTAIAELGERKARPFIEMGHRMARGMMNITGMLN